MRIPRPRPLVLAAIGILFFAVILYVWAGITAAASGGTAISADTAATGGNGAWTTLSGPTYRETVNGDIASGGFVTLTVPAGFEFNTTNAVSVALTAGDKIAAANMNETAVGGNVAPKANVSLTVSATTISFYVLSKSRGNTLNTIQWQGIQVRPTQGTPLATGNILIGVPAGSLLPSSTNGGTLTEVPGALARLFTVLPGQSFANGSGITGTAAAQIAGTSFNLAKLVATDKFNNTIPSYAGTKSITYTGPANGCGAAPTYTNSVSFTNGTSTTTLSTMLIKAETASITASDGTVAGPASSSFMIAPAPIAGLLVTMPGQTFTPCLGNSGTPADQAAGVSFDIAAISAVDRFLNVITTYAGSKSVSYSGPAGTNTYTSPVNFTSGKSTTALTTTISTAQTTSITVSDGAVSGPQGSSFVVRSTVSSFNAFDTATPAGAFVGVIKTKIAGTGFSMDVVALTNAPAVATGFTGTVKVELVDSTGGVCASSPVVQVFPNLVFAASDGGRRTIGPVTEANAWKNVRLRISYPATAPTSISCSNDNFSIRPDRFSVVAATDQDPSTAGTARPLANLSVPGGVVHKAGQLFTITATALNSSGIATTNYVGAPNSLISPCSISSVCPSAASLGILSVASWSNSAGVLTTGNASYSEVGAFSLMLQDQTFSDVDAGDSTSTERYVSSAVSGIGRFVPDHFAIVPTGIVPRADLPACSTASFTYMDEPLRVSFSLIAQNAAPVNGTTQNYQGTLATFDAGNASHLNFGGIDTTVPTPLVAPIIGITRENPGKVTTGMAHGLVTGGTVFVSGVMGMNEVNNKTYEVIVIDAKNFTVNASTTSFSLYAGGGNASRLALASSSGTWTAGAATVISTIALLRSAQPDGPFDNVSIGIAPRDLDGVTTAFSNLDADGDTQNERQRMGVARFLFGRLQLDNAYGSELLNLTIPMQAQYWTGASFRQNLQDNCTAISSAANVPLTNYRGGINALNMASPGNIQVGTTFMAGKGRLVLTKPLPAPSTKGSADLTVNLDAEAKKYLQVRGTALKYDRNPSSRATFGLYKSGPVIYVRETY